MDILENKSMTVTVKIPIHYSNPNFYFFHFLNVHGIALQQNCLTGRDTSTDECRLVFLTSTKTTIHSTTLASLLHRSEFPLYIK